MKIKTIAFFIGLFALQMDAQETYIQLLSQGDTLFRFQRIEVNQYDDFSDTLITQKFPDRWLDSAQLMQYQEVTIGQLLERKTELNRLRKLVNAEANLHISFYDQVQGEGAYLAKQKEKLLNAIQGPWRLIDRKGEVKKDEINIEGNVFKKNNNRQGTITITDDLEILVTGYNNFDLIFTVNNAGIWRYQRNQNRLFILRR